jgi:hypothetical protein
MKLDKIVVLGIKGRKNCIREFIDKYWNTLDYDRVSYIDLDGKLKKA